MPSLASLRSGRQVHGEAGKAVDRKLRLPKKKKDSELPWNNARGLHCNTNSLFSSRYPIKKLPPHHQHAVVKFGRHSLAERTSGVTGQIIKNITAVRLEVPGTGSEQSKPDRLQGKGLEESCRWSRSGLEEEREWLPVAALIIHPNGMAARPRGCSSACVRATRGSGYPAGELYFRIRTVQRRTSHTSAAAEATPSGGGVGRSKVPCRRGGHPSHCRGTAPHERPSHLGNLRGASGAGTSVAPALPPLPPRYAEGWGGPWTLALALASPGEPC